MQTYMYYKTLQLPPSFLLLSLEASTTVVILGTLRITSESVVV
jgi:hypothetical protein